VDVYTTEQEQIERIKKWWNENGKAIVFGLALGLAGLFGYRYWVATRVAEGQSASLNYEHLLRIASVGASDEATAAGEAIINGYPHTTYAKMAALVLAKLAVDERDLDQAKTRLQWVIDNSPGGKIEPVAQARLAEIYLADGDVENAASILKKIAPEYDGQFAEIRGDVFAAQGDTENARAMYDRALAEAQERGSAGSAIQLKLDNLSLAGK